MGRAAWATRCLAQLSLMLESFHIQTLRPPKDTKANALGHKGTTCPTTMASGRVNSWRQLRDAHEPEDDARAQ
jgi:hypothetical protein